jgi:hypothetical protein
MAMARAEAVLQTNYCVTGVMGNVKTAQPMRMFCDVLQYRKQTQED